MDYRGYQEYIHESLIRRFNLTLCCTVFYYPIKIRQTDDLWADPLCGMIVCFIWTFVYSVKKTE